MSLLSIIFNWLSPICGLVGSILIYKYGIPEKTDTKGAISLCLEQVDEAEIIKIAKYKRRSNWGLILIIFSFTFQLGTASLDFKQEQKIIINTIKETITAYQLKHPMNK